MSLVPLVDSFPVKGHIEPQKLLVMLKPVLFHLILIHLSPYLSLFKVILKRLGKNDNNAGSCPS